ncbi:hypothetical protein BC332_18845 [Capsicum chinense]|nr:hypothetical protein BC332_18845 [Capsicum chinense]
MIAKMQGFIEESEVINETLRLGNVDRFLHRKAVKDVRYKVDKIRFDSLGPWSMILESDNVESWEVFKEDQEEWTTDFSQLFIAAQVAVGMGIPLWQIQEIRRFYRMEHGAGYDAWRKTSIVATPFDFDKAESTRPKGLCVAVVLDELDLDLYLNSRAFELVLESFSLDLEV